MWISCELQMTSVNWEVICVIFIFLQIHASGSLYSSLVLLPDSENMGLVVVISLLSCTQAEMCVISTSELGRHLDFSQMYTPGSFRSSLIV